MTMPRLLLVDDDVEYAEILAEALTRRGCRVTIAHTATDALALAAQQPFEDAVLDLRLANEYAAKPFATLSPSHKEPENAPKASDGDGDGLTPEAGRRVSQETPPGNGLSLIAPLREKHPEIRILLLTGYASIATAIEAIKLGATHYLAKPSSADEILAALGRVSGKPDIAIDEAPMSVDRVEWEHIQRILYEQGGNVSAAARALKMHRRTLQRKLGKRPSPG